MPLVNDHTYVIYNELTHSVLDLTGNLNRRLFVMSWGWHAGINQKWTTDNQHAAENVWKLRNENLHNNQHRYLSPQLEDGLPDDNYRLVGGILPCEFTVEATADKYRILYNGKAVSLVTGKKVHKIEPRDVVHDLHAYGAPIALQDREDNPAQFWIFHDLTGVDAFNTIINNSRLPAGTYKVVNSETGTVLGIRETVNKPVQGLSSNNQNENERKWTITRNPNNSDYYTFRSLSADTPYLAPEPGNETALIGHGNAQNFTVRKVPGTNLYKIFFKSLAVNLAVVDGSPDSVDGAVVSLQAAEAQTWYFIRAA